MKKIINFSHRKPSKKLRDIGTRLAQVEAATVADALNAEAVLDRELRGSGLTLYALRDALYTQLTSTGGRPGIVGSTRRQKIPLSEQDWHALADIADELDSKPSPAQVGAMLIRFGIAQVRKSGSSQLVQMP